MYVLAMLVMHTPVHTAHCNAHTKKNHLFFFSCLCTGKHLYSYQQSPIYIFSTDGSVNLKYLPCYSHFLLLNGEHLYYKPGQ